MNMWPAKLPPFYVVDFTYVGPYHEKKNFIKQNANHVLILQKDV